MSRGGRAWLLLGCLAFGLAAAVHGARVVFDSVGSAQWPVASGTVAANESSAAGSRHKSLPARRPAYLTYTYGVGGRAFTGHRIAFAPWGPATTLVPYDDEIAARFPAGAPVRVFYDPHDPGRAVLEPGTPPIAWLTLAAGLLLLAAAGRLGTYRSPPLVTVDGHLVSATPADGALPDGWVATRSPSGELEVRRARGARSTVAGVVAVASGVWLLALGAAVAAGVPPPLGASPAVGVGIGVVLAAFAAWIALADEWFSAAPNQLAHRLRFLSLTVGTPRRDGALEVETWVVSHGRRRYRLNAVTPSGRRTLVRGSLDEIERLLRVFATETGWPRREWVK